MPQDPIKLILYHATGCCLCDRLESFIQQCVARTGTPGFSNAVTLIKFDISDDPYRREQFGTRIPVLTSGGKVILEGRPSSQEVEQVLRRLISDSSRA